MTSHSFASLNEGICFVLGHMHWLNEQKLQNLLPKVRRYCSYVFVLQIGFLSFIYLFMYLFSQRKCCCPLQPFSFSSFFSFIETCITVPLEKKKKQKNKSSWLIFLKQPKIEQVGLPVMQKQHSWCVSLSFSNGNTVCCLTASALTGWPDTLKQ